MGVVTASSSSTPTNASASSRCASKVCTALVAIQRYDNSVFTNSMLEKLGIYTTKDRDHPRWLPDASAIPSHPHLDCKTPDRNPALLRPPEKLPRNANRTALEWATHFSEMATVLARPITDASPPAAKPPADSSARPSPINWDNPVEQLLAKGEAHSDHKTWCWKATALLRANGEGPEGCRSVGCIAFDDSRDPLPEHVPYRRSELLCLVTLVCHAMSRTPMKNPIVATLLMFTSTTLRVLQMRINPNDRDGPNLYITTRDTLSLDNITSEVGYGDWLQVISWLRFRFVSHQAMPSEELFPKDEGSEARSDRGDVVRNHKQKAASITELDMLRSNDSHELMPGTRWRLAVAYKMIRPGIEAVLERSWSERFDFMRGIESAALLSESVVEYITLFQDFVQRYDNNDEDRDYNVDPL
ncbi:hypothetical protein CKAH01_13793 [Colletotrichum kahawae]|uniref:Uncharacterized protein n=1 Tax=Colletotrichum kahawae TaxID=34407 RepID=A0AAE0DB07_COLKA|nr:hypothetical protein CKAH01_13793 [Colletotrichum kahawae]